MRESTTTCRAFIADKSSANWARLTETRRMETTLTQPLTLLDAFRSFLTDKADVDIVKFLLGVFILDADDGFGRHFLSSCRSGHLRERKSKVRMYYYLCSCTLMYLPITRQDHYNSIHSVTMKQNLPQSPIYLSHLATFNPFGVFQQ